MDVVLTEMAENDLEEAFLWYKNQSSELSSDFLLCIAEGLKSLESFPFRWRKRIDDVRAAKIKKFPFLIYFRIHENVVEITAIGHTRRNPGNWVK